MTTTRLDRQGTYHLQKGHIRPDKSATHSIIYPSWYSRNMPLLPHAHRSTASTNLLVFLQILPDEEAPFSTPHAAGDEPPNYTASGWYLCQVPIRMADQNIRWHDLAGEAGVVDLG